MIPVKTFDTRTWLFLPGADLWEDKKPTKKRKTWIANLYNLSLLLSHFTPSFLCTFCSLSLSPAHWGVLLYCLIEVKMWRTKWGPTKTFSACFGWLNVQKKKKKKQSWKISGSWCIVAEPICGWYYFSFWWTFSKCVCNMLTNFITNGYVLIVKLMTKDTNDVAANLRQKLDRACNCVLIVPHAALVE